MAARVAKRWIPSGKEIKPEDTYPTKDNLADWFIHMKYDNINYDFIMNTFGSFGDDVLAHTYDLLEVPPKSFTFKDYNGKEKSNTNTFVTTLGIWIYNKALNEFGLSKLFNGYINENLNKKKYKNKVEDAIACAVIEDEITTKQVEDFENFMQWIMPFEDILSPNHTEKQLVCARVIEKRKKELLKKYQKEISEGNLVVTQKIVDELLDLAKDYLADDPYLDTIESQAGGDFNNNFRNMYVMRGAVANEDPTAKQKYNVVTSNLIDGIKPNEYSTMAGAGVGGAYSRSKKTADGGYEEKLFVYAYQYLTLDPPGSDCGTKRHITVNLTEDNIKAYMYSNIIKPNGDLEMLTSKNKDKYIGKKVNFRFSSMCESKTGICDKCAGALLRMSGDNIGMVLSQIPDKLKLIAMKAFHDGTIKTTKFDAQKAFYPFDD